MESRSHAIAAGLLALAFVSGLLAAVAWLSNRGKPYLNVFTLETESSVAGLNPQASVKYRGVEVGRVRRIRFDPQRRHAILIDIAVDPLAHVSTATYARLAYQGITGLAHIELNDDSSDAPPLATSALRPARIPMRPSALQEFGDAGQALLVRVNDIAEKLNVLLSEENRARLGRSLESIERMTKNFVSFQDKLGPTLDALPGLATRADRLLAESETLVEEVNDATRRVNERVDVLDRLGDNADRLGTAASDLSVGTLPGLNRLLEKFSRTAENLDRVLEAQSRDPQSLLFGATPPEPGPGEPGFLAKEDRRE